MPPKSLSKNKSWMRLLRNSQTRYKRQLTGKYKMHSRNMKTPQIKKLEKTQKQLNELREVINKHQSKTKETIKKRYMK
jgi:hypothetical protein